MEELKITCFECGCIIEDADDAREVNGEYVCEDCYCDNYVVCDHCGDVEHVDNTRYIDDNIVCDYCYDRLYTVCEWCHEDVERSEAYESIDGLICPHCYENYGVTCADCGEVLHIDDAFYDDYNEEYYCRDCEDNRAERVIHDYYYKPDAVFFGKDSSLYMGIELEIDGAGEDDDNAQKLLDIAGEQHIYMKHDGSLKNGFEIVSHPATLAYHQHHIEWSEMLEKAREMGYKSHDAGTCGLHVHVSKMALGNTYLEQDETLSKILYFIEKYYDRFLKFSRRTAEQLEHWASRYGIEDGEKPADILNKAKSCYNRYRLINLQNSYTIEFRLFRGTLKYNTFIATLQLVRHLCDMCIELDKNDIETISWRDFVTSIENAENNYSELLQYLADRQLKENF